MCFTAHIHSKNGYRHTIYYLIYDILYNIWYIFWPTLIQYNII
jgi:hypothetical protein